MRVVGAVYVQVGEVVQVDVVGVVPHAGGDGLLALQAAGPAVGREGELRDTVLGPEVHPRGDVLGEQQAQAAAEEVLRGIRGGREGRL
ncbi:hypothetical protein GCM10020256_06010 [Streptomyces thermocoprophilus]